MPEAKDLITDTNVVKTYTQGKWVVFELDNGIRVKLDPNKVPSKIATCKK